MPRISPIWSAAERPPFWKNRTMRWFLIAAAGCLAAASLPRLASPIAGLKPNGLRNTYTEIHNGHPHEAIDIMEPRGTPVQAVAPGLIRKLFLSKPGGNTIYQFDDSQTFCF